MNFSVAPTSPNIWPICSRPSARPHLAKLTCASSANRSRMLPPVDVTPPLSNAFRYSSATDLRCSSVMVSRAIATAPPPRRCLSAAVNLHRRGRGGDEREDQDEEQGARFHRAGLVG